MTFIFGSKFDAIKKILSILALAFLLAKNADAQIVNAFKNLLPEKHFHECLEAEKKINLPYTAKDGNVYLNLGRKTLVHSEDLTLLYERKALHIFDSLQIDTSIAATSLSMCFPLINKGLYHQADTLIQKVIAISHKLNKEKLRIDAYLRLGYKESASGNSVEALKAYFKIYDYYKNNPNQEGLGDVTMRIGITYRDIGDCQTALKYWERYIKDSSNKVPKDRFIAPIKSYAAQCYLTLNATDKARIYAKEVIKNIPATQSHKLLSQNYLLLAQIEFIEKKYKTAKAFIDSSYHYALRFDNNKVLATVLLNKAKIYRHVKSPNAIIPMLEKALHLIRLAPSPSVEKEIYDELSKNHLLENKLSQAIYYDQKKDSIGNILFSNEVIAKIKDFEKEIERKNSAEKIMLLTTQNNLKNANIKQQKSINTYIISVLVLSLLLLSIAAYFLYQRNILNNRLAEKNKAIEASLEVNKMLVKEIHHRVKNNLQLISSLLGLQTRFAQSANVQQAIQASKSRVQAMSLLHQNLYQTDDIQKVYIKKYFEDVCDNLKETYALANQNIGFYYEIDDICLDLDQVVTLGLIMNELVTNAIRHAFVQQQGGSIVMKIKRKEQDLHLHIKDNGLGIPFTHLPEKSISMGMQLISAFIKKLEASIEILNNSGTEINIYCKIESNEASEQ